MYMYIIGTTAKLTRDTGGVCHREPSLPGEWYVVPAFRFFVEYRRLKPPSRIDCQKRTVEKRERTRKREERMRKREHDRNVTARAFSDLAERERECGREESFAPFGSIDPHIIHRPTDRREYNIY